MITPGTYVNDIRMGSLTVPYLLQGGITVLYVDGTKDGASPCQYSYRTFVSGLIPSKAAKLLTYSIITYGSSLIGLASSVLFGSNAILAYFNPPNAASRFVPPNSNQDEITVGVATIAQLLGIPAPITIIPVPQFTAIDATFSILDMETVPTYPESVYEAVVNQPLISNQGEYNCLNYKYLFDTDTTDAFVTGTLTTYAPFLPKTSTMLDTFLFTLFGLIFGTKSSTFQNVPGYSANLQGVNCNQLGVPTSCADIVAMPSSTMCPSTSGSGVLPRDY
jgi:hypothetical protein